MTVLYLCKGFILHVVFGEINSDVMTNCDTYLMIVTASIPFLALYDAGAAVHRCMGDSQTPMIISLAMNGLNVVGNAALLYGLNWGIEGAAVPSLISRAFAACWMVYLLRDTSKTLHIRNLSQFRPNHGLIKEILHVGVPYSFENSMFQLGKILVLSLVSRLGTASITANAVGNSVSIPCRQCYGVCSVSCNCPVRGCWGLSPSTLLYTEADNNDLYWKLDYVLPAVSIAPGAHFCLPVTA